MLTGKCFLCIATFLYPLAVISIICNIVLFFPGGEVKYEYITQEVKYMGGLVGGGLMMFFSIAFAAVGAAGALYSFIVAVLGLQNGPLCKVDPLSWLRPLKDSLSNIPSYLTEQSKWGLCPSHKNIVQFNVRLFTTLVTTSVLQLILCGILMINGLFGCLRGTCKEGRRPGGAATSGW